MRNFLQTLFRDQTAAVNCESPPWWIELIASLALAGMLYEPLQLAFTEILAHRR